MGTKNTNKEKKDFLFNEIRFATEIGGMRIKAKLLAEFCLKFNSSKKTANEMLGNMLEVGMIELVLNHDEKECLKMRKERELKELDKNDLKDELKYLDGKPEM